MNTLLPLLLCVLLASSYLLGFRKAKSLLIPNGPRLSSRPVYHGCYTLLWSALPLVVLCFLWLSFSPLVLKSMVMTEHQSSESSTANPDLSYTEIKNVATGATSIGITQATLKSAERYRALSSTSSRFFWGSAFSLSIFGLLLSWRRIRNELRARDFVEQIFRACLFLSSVTAIAVTVGIICSLIFESIRFFQMVPISDFLFGTKWSPQMAIRADQVASSGAFGAIPLLAGTMLIASIAMFFAAPIGLLAAIFLSEYAPIRVRQIAKPLLEILAGVPTVVYGVFAAITVAPWIRNMGESLGLSVSSESALAAGSVMGIMIIPFVSSLADDVINSVPQDLRNASLALGATKSETIKKVVVPAALPGIVGAVLLALSRAIGETMIVVMAAGLSANLTMNPLASVTTVTVQMVTILVGDQEFDSAKTLSAFALGLLLFVATLILNFIALQIVKRYREKYD